MVTELSNVLPRQIGVLRAKTCLNRHKMELGEDVGHFTMAPPEALRKPLKAGEGSAVWDSIVIANIHSIG